MLQLALRKKGNKKEKTKKWGHPLSWLVIEDGNDLTISLTEIEPHNAIKTNMKKVRRKDSSRKEYKESNLE